MKKDEFSTLIKEIGSCEDITQVRDKLLTLEKEVVKDYDLLDTTSKERDDLKSDNENLRNANMKLFLQVGSNNKEPEINKNSKTSNDLKYENLFDEKGELK